MKELLKNRNAMMIWFSRSFSRFGDAFETLAFMYLIYELTGSALAMGTVMFFSVVPNIIVSPIAGVICDKHYTKKIMIIAEGVRTITILAIPILHYTGQLNIWMIYLIAVLVSSAESFFEPCAQITMLKVIKKEQLAVFNSAVTTSNQIAKLSGYALSGILMSLAGMDLLFLIDSFTFLCSALTILALHIPKEQIEILGANSKGQKDEGIFKSIVTAVKYVSDTVIPIILLTIILNTMLMVPIMDFLPLVSKEIFHQGSTLAGCAMTVLSVGTILGSIMFPIIQKKNVKLKEFILIGNLLMGLITIGSIATNSLIIAILIYLILGVIGSITSLWCSTEIQCSCKMEYLGRVASLLSIAMIISDPLSATVSGWVIDLVSIQTVFIITGVLFIGFGIILFTLYRVTEKKQLISVSVKEKLADI